jgi:hypothetical protein
MNLAKKHVIERCHGRHPETVQARRGPDRMVIEVVEPVGLPKDGIETQHHCKSESTVTRHIFNSPSREKFTFDSPRGVSGSRFPIRFSNALLWLE